MMRRRKTAAVNVHAHYSTERRSPHSFDSISFMRSGHVSRQTSTYILTLASSAASWRDAELQSWRISSLFIQHPVEEAINAIWSIKAGLDAASIPTWNLPVLSFLISGLWLSLFTHTHARARTEWTGDPAGDTRADDDDGDDGDVPASILSTFEP